MSYVKNFRGSSSGIPGTTMRNGHMSWSPSLRRRISHRQCLPRADAECDRGEHTPPGRSVRSRSTRPGQPVTPMFAHPYTRVRLRSTWVRPVSRPSIGSKEVCDFRDPESRDRACPPDLANPLVLMVGALAAFRPYHDLGGAWPRTCCHAGADRRRALRRRAAIGPASRRARRPPGSLGGLRAAALVSGSRVQTPSRIPRWVHGLRPARA